MLADTDWAMYDYMFPGGYPSLLLLEEDMKVRAYNRFDYKVAMQSPLDGMK